MAVAKRLIAALLAMLVAYMPGPVWAAYANLSPPPGWSQGGSGAWKVAYKPGDQLLAGLLKKSFTPKDWGGGAAKMTAGFRYSTLAGRTAATIISLHPAVRVALGVSAWLSIGKLLWDDARQTWVKSEDVDASGYLWTTTYTGATKYGSAGTACEAARSKMAQSLASNTCVGRTASIDFCGNLSDGRVILRAKGGVYNGVACSDAQYVYGLNGVPGCPGGESPPCLTTKLTDVTPAQMADELAKNPMPTSVPSELPDGSELPVDKVVLNPGPGTDMTPHTMRIPTGDPVPTADPTKWRQPYVDVIPSPTADQPFRVDVRPGDKLVDDPAPMPDPVTDPAPDPTATPKPEEQQDLCDKHPDILACQKIELGELSAETVPNEDKTITLTPDTGWGPSGSCPSPRTVNLHGGLTLSIPLDLMCEFARMIRPLIVAAAYLGAAMMLVGAARKD